MSSREGVAGVGDAHPVIGAIIAVILTSHRKTNLKPRPNYPECGIARRFITNYFSNLFDIPTKG